VRLAVDPDEPILQLPLYAAFGQRLFAKQRLRLSLIDMSDGRRTVDAVTSGACHLASSGFEEVLRTSTNGGGLTAFALLSRSPLLALIAALRPRRRHQSAEDLDGERIAIANSGDATDRFARYVAGEAGLGPDDIEVVAKGTTADAAAAFQKREVAAAVVDVATAQMLDQQQCPYAVLADTRTLAGLLETYGVSNYPASCLFADGAWLRANADRARRVAKGIAAGLEWVQSHRSEELVGLLPEWYRQRHDAPMLTTVIDQARPLFSRTGAFTADGMDAARKVVAVSVEALRKSTVPTTAYTNTYLPNTRK
jgi:NitT/TauT family transport system substrate-binding protein